MEFVAKGENAGTERLHGTHAFNEKKNLHGLDSTQ